MEKWKKAVIHLECATDSEHFLDRIKRIDNLREDLKEGRITPGQFTEETSSRSRDIRCHGTAIFLEHDRKRYLITARHVLWDEISAKREYLEESGRAKEWPERMQPSMMESAKIRFDEKIFGIVFRVPSVDEVLEGKFDRDRAFLMNLGAGPSYTGPYTFSAAGLDLAIVSLGRRFTYFADELIVRGYEPIAISDIAEAPTRECAEVYTVGYPEYVSVLGMSDQPAALAHWSSSYFSLPTFSFGRVAMLHDSLPYFFVDMSVYPGNSGGPIVENGRLVGVVTNQPTMPVEGQAQLRVGIPCGLARKASYIPQLLSTQIKKDAWWRDKPTPHERS